VLAVLQGAKIIGLRAGTTPHRFVGVWVVVVDERVFVRSWNDKPSGWHQAFVATPRGVLQIPGREIEVRARKARGERLLAAIDCAYGDKYNTPGSRKYVLGFRRDRRRTTTTELVPWPRIERAGRSPRG
jgi:hypothetical protein